VEEPLATGEDAPPFARSPSPTRPGVGTFAVVPVGWPRGRFGPLRPRPAAEVTHRERW
jgi:hypothetical protein